MSETPKKSNISKSVWIFLICVALFFDVLEAVFVETIIGGTLIDIFAFATFALIFKMNGEKYSKKTFFGGFIIGFIPILNMLPECTASIVMLYLDAKAKNALAKVPGGQLAAQAGIQGHIARNTTIVNGEMRNKSDMGNRNAKPAFSRFQDAPTGARGTPTQKDNIAPINSKENISSGGYDRWNKEQHEKMGLTQGMPGSRFGGGDPFHSDSGGVNKNHDFTGGGEKVVMLTRSSKKPKSYEDVREEERKHYEEWNSKKKAA